MRFYFVVLTIFFLPTLFSQSLKADEKANTFKETFRRIEAYAEQERLWSGTPGLTLALTSSDRTLHVINIGDSDLKLHRAVDETTLFQIGSISKSFTALALLKLAEEGKVDLSEPISKALPWFSVRSNYAAITPHHLLTHTAGIPVNRDDLPGTPYMAVALREQETAWPPGSNFLYSNVGYQVLHVLLEKAAKQSWAKVVQRSILDPVGMSSTEPAITYEMRERQAVGYIYKDGLRPEHRSRALAEAPFFEYTIGDGSVVSTATDMAAYVRLLLRAGDGLKRRVVSTQSFERFIQPGIINKEGGGYGYGINVDRSGGGLVLSHGGGMVGFHSFLSADLDTGIGVVVLANGPSNTGKIARYALEVLRAAFRGDPLPELPLPADPLTVKNAVDYAGRFQSPNREQFIIEARKSSLWVNLGDKQIQLERDGEDSFYSLDQGLDRYILRFQRNDTGQVVTVTHGPRWFANHHYDGPTEFETPVGWDAYVGRYHSQSPWFSGFTVFIRKGELWTVSGGGGETTAGYEARLEPVDGRMFRPEASPSPERVVFDEINEGHSWQASWSGHRFYRIGIQ